MPYQPKEKLYGEHPTDPLFPKDAIHALMVQAGYLATRLSVYFQLSEKPHTKRDEIEAWGEVIKKMDHVTQLIAEVRGQPTPEELLDELQNIVDMAEESPLLQLGQFIEYYSNIRKVMAKTKPENPQPK